MEVVMRNYGYQIEKKHCISSTDRWRNGARKPDYGTLVEESVINAENLTLFEPSLLVDDPDEDTCLPSVDDFKIEREDPLHEDCILEQKVR
ncbi:hypothetical protein L3X38_041204 [Prunus dulcis]|uniref:Uncharacterized protein n=1 Tax=Prunus dulcis TaxID=3755 RepID=A0AAD4UUB0_PRUDU|nr:hypothetical protein L3X38_041204 [Prunus dulcis]